MAEVLGRIEQAEAHKAEGNAHVKSGDYKKALGAYWKVFCFLNGLQMPDEGGAQKVEADTARADSNNRVPLAKAKEVKKLKETTHLNMALCYLKKEAKDGRKCVDACNKAIEFGGASSKAYYRRGQGQIELEDFEEARKDLEKARDLEPGDRNIASELRLLEQLAKTARLKEKGKYSGMFEKSVEKDGPTLGSALGGDTAEGSADGPHIEELPDDDGKGGASGSSSRAQSEVAAESAKKPAPPAEEPVGYKEPERHPATNMDVCDEASRPNITVRPLTYAWEQTDDDVKIYIPFDQCEELEGGVGTDRVKVEFGEWNFLVVIEGCSEGRAPLGLRLGDFHARVAPSHCKMTVRSSRITLKLRKLEKSNWWNLLQKSGS